MDIPVPWVGTSLALIIRRLEGQRWPEQAAVARSVPSFVLAVAFYALLKFSSAVPSQCVAWIHTGGPEVLAAQAIARLEVIADTYLSMNAPIQHALPTLLAQRTAFQHQLRVRLRSPARRLRFRRSVS